jgi:hypothetical protein
MSTNYIPRNSKEKTSTSMTIQDDDDRRWQEWIDYCAKYKTNKDDNKCVIKFIVGDKVKTSHGIGMVYKLDDNVVCVQLEHDPEVIYEFNMDEIEKYE